MLPPLQREGQNQARQSASAPADDAGLDKADDLAFHAVRRNGDLPEAAGGRLDDLYDSFDRQGAQRQLGGQTTKATSTPSGSSGEPTAQEASKKAVEPLSSRLSLLPSATAHLRAPRAAADEPDLSRRCDRA